MSNPISPVKVYLPIDTKIETPEDGYYFTLHPNTHSKSGLIESACEYCDGDFYMPEDKGYPSDINKIPFWLKEQSKYVFSREELEKLIADAFHAGDHFRRDVLNGFEDKAPNIPQFINSLFKQ